MLINIIHGDSLEVLKTLPENSVDAVVTDPPYGLKFMGKKWDADVPSQALWSEVIRVLKPGGHLLSFGGTRTYHHLVMAIDLAGFEIRDQLQWIYGSGFPKSHNLGDGRGTALKPANEPIVLARKPLSESTVAKNVLKWGTGALNIDASRIETSETLSQGSRNPGSNFDDDSYEWKGIPGVQHSQGRWPANVIFDKSAAEMLGEPSRFFYCAKTSKAQRNRGLEGMPEKNPPGSKRSKPAEGRASPLGAPRANHHPTVKPQKLMEYLIKLITPPQGVVLDPFMGSGSTGVACKNLGFGFIGIDMNEEYVEIAKKRIGKPPDQSALYGIDRYELEEG